MHLMLFHHTIVVTAQDYTNLSGKGVTEYCESTGFSASLKWLLTLASTGQIPSNGVVPQDKVSKHKNQVGWGQIENIGVGKTLYDIPFIRPPPKALTGREFWALPDDVVVDPTRIHISSSSISPLPCPPVTFTDEVRKIKKRKPQNTEEKGNPDVETHSSPENEDESDDDGDRSDVAPMTDGVPTQWGANFGHCVIGAFAVIQSDYDQDRKGISVIQVLISCYINVFV